MDEDKNKKEPDKIDSGEKLQEWIDNSDKFREEAEAKIAALEASNAEKDEKIEKLTDAVEKQADLTIIKKHKWEDEDTEEGKNYRFGKMLYAIKERDTNTLAKMGVERLHSDNRDVKTYSLGKTDLGTPLTGDATGTDWQYAIPAYIYATDFLRTMDIASEIIPQLTKVPMSGRLVRWPTQGSTVFEFTFVTNEVTSKAEQKPTISYVDLECETFAGWTGVTDELMEDTFLDIGGILRMQAIEDLQYTIEEQALNGSGSPFTGALRNTSVNSLVIDSTTFDGVTWADLLSGIEALTTSKKRVGASFVMHPTVWDELASKQDGSGRYFFDPTRGLGRTAWGYPVLLSDAMPSTSAVSTAFILFGNLKYIYHGTRMGLEVKYFDQTMYALQDDENFFRIRTRFADVVSIPANFVAITTAAS